MSNLERQISAVGQPLRSDESGVMTQYRRHGSAKEIR